MSNISESNIPDVICLDLNGVIQDPQSGNTYPEAKKVIDFAKENEIPVVILSNSTMGEGAFINKMKDFGYVQGEDYQAVLSAGMSFKMSVADDPASLINKEIKNKKIYAIGHAFEALLEGTEFSFTKNKDEADFAYIGIPQLSPAQYKLLPDDLKSGFTPSEIVEGNWDVLSSSPEATQYFYDKYIKELSLPIMNANQDKVVSENVSYSSEAVSLYRQGQFATMAKEDGKNVIETGKPDIVMYQNFSKVIKDITGNEKSTVAFYGDNMGTDLKGYIKASNLFSADSYHVLCVNNYYIGIDSASENKDIKIYTSEEVLSGVKLHPWFSDKVAPEDKKKAFTNAKEIYGANFKSLKYNSLYKGKVQNTPFNY
ncbi:MAG: hypothetical protein R3Y43_06105 [Alphaproteobacteria bacterium]